MIDTSLTTFPDSATSNKPKVVDANYDNSKMSQNDFLKVLLADLKWQDPMNAKDISDFIDNSVKLRQMESLDSIQKLVDTLSTFTNSIVNASSMIGKKVKYEGNQTYISQGQSNIEFKLNAPAQNVKVSLVDSNGNIVEQKEFTNLNGNTTYPLSIENQNLTDGYYKVLVSAKDSAGNDVQATIYSTGIVNGILKDNSSLSAKINNVNVSLDKILEISM
ncbi:MAG TPA: flagellar hook capping protein [Sulfurihydrogenibium sp.]|uniref:flagellar hook assembly protein FlgD n=1 Tax=Sulfurihydrogenibium sp. (strain YO3AOP1) TaxID=436114 RepID=UPI000172675B|nr:flagellar hook capping FlgD N-terminal domain-containing protein [Sulfurihydrogenibium sp. YO3AOP1]ACD67237.1 flagellar hook capping protein [Sulfurihydrogenibium sp. YO3AOP1]HBT98314.1 flagellar hook capping protein [Sulfurihydrogenibium sp.]